jgi:hypothetical protein
MDGSFYKALNVTSCTILNKWRGTLTLRPYDIQLGSGIQSYQLTAQASPCEWKKVTHSTTGKRTEALRYRAKRLAETAPMAECLPSY